jgi:hypothetical protein
MAEDIRVLWRDHQGAPLPEVAIPNKGELWVLDEVISGCISSYLETGPVLDEQRLSILKDCRNDLNRLLPELDGAAATYFSRLEILADLILARQTSSDGL